MLTVIILTFNSEKIIERAIKSAKLVTNNILVVDDFSNDNTVSIAKKNNCKVLQHKFTNYSEQRNWAQKNIKGWVFHLDSDEVISIELANSIKQALKDPKVDGFLVRRLTYFRGKPIIYGHTNPEWHLRLFKNGQCEERLYDQHFIIDGPTERIEGLLFDFQEKTEREWIDQHRVWAVEEAKEIVRNEKTKKLPPSLKGDSRMKKRWAKKQYYKLPILTRPFIFFFYNFILKRGFMDGINGVVYHILHAFWFRFLIDVKILELRFIKQSNSR
jgi:glycosyltransferase involved in cell wall biosynthesis